MAPKLCPDCYGDIHDERHVICPHCGKPLPKTQYSGEDADDGIFCQTQTIKKNLKQEKKTLTKIGVKPNLTITP